MKRSLIVAAFLLVIVSTGCIRLETEESEPIPVHSAPTQIGSEKNAVTIDIPVTPTRTTPQETSTPPPQAYNWKNWPVLPQVSKHAKEIYMKGLTQGNNAMHFSILGDCQSMPDIFMGRYASNLDIQAGLPESLRETVSVFSSSLTRMSPTVKPGTTAGAILWKDWIDRSGFTDCTPDETPLDCELRTWNPSIVLINLGTHSEIRDQQYLDLILDKLIGKGVLPILATKADNREGDNSVNLMIAETAEKYDIPFWNFWSAVQDLSNGGLKAESEVAEIYLTDEALEVHRYSALQVIDAVWRQANTP